MLGGPKPGPDFAEGISQNAQAQVEEGATGTCACMYQVCYVCACLVCLLSISMSTTRHHLFVSHLSPIWCVKYE